MDGALHTSAFTVQHVGGDHRRGDAAMAEQLLDGSNVVAVGQEVRGEAVV